MAALVSTVVVVVAGVWLITSTEGWDRTKASFFNWSIGWESLPTLLTGLWVNLRVTAVCMVLVVIFGMLLALARTSRSPLLFPARAFAIAYTDLFRGLPLILVLMICGFAIPGLRLAWQPDNPAVVYGGMALVLTYSAYVAEVFRAGIESVHPGQRLASMSLGLSTTQTMRTVVLPQASRRVIPPLLNDLLSLIKDSGLISVLGAIDAVRSAQIATATYANFTPYIMVGILFVLVTIPLTRVTDWYARRKGWLGSSGGAAGGYA